MIEAPWVCSTRSPMRSLGSLASSGDGRARRGGQRHRRIHPVPGRPREPRRQFFHQKGLGSVVSSWVGRDRRPRRSRRTRSPRDRQHAGVGDGAQAGHPDAGESRSSSPSSRTRSTCSTPALTGCTTGAAGGEGKAGYTRRGGDRVRPSAAQVDVTPALYEDLDRDFEGFRGRYLVAKYSFEGDWPTWEIHPKGDEVVVLLAGAADMLLDEGGRHRVVKLTSPASS